MTERLVREYRLTLELERREGESGTDFETRLDQLGTELQEWLTRFDPRGTTAANWEWDYAIETEDTWPETET